ncbi:hypothetical protein [Photobacterium leiognathi]|uniref:hypothetical protein n=1 Tax=Photobacterium leiognathi TaxID=553611 RepID=UPI002981AF35|nr:hypothetical protein [Photobacterium leiognathi]
MTNTEKTKRFLFFTGGTDSVLLLNMITKLLKHKLEDELVVVMVSNPNLTSGQESNIQKAIEMLSANLISDEIHNDQQLINRISLLIPSMGIQNFGEINIAATSNKQEQQKLTLPEAKHDAEFIQYRSCLALQEVTILGTLPQISLYLGCCKNVVYIGACGTDIGTQQTDKLTQFFDLFYNIGLSPQQTTPLLDELEDNNIETFRRQGDKKFKKEWAPTLEAPLKGMRKQDVVMALTMLKNSYHTIDKAENLCEHYSTDKDQMIGYYTSIYHDLIKLYNYPENAPSLFQFIKEDQGQFGDVLVDSTTIAELAKEKKIELLMRATKMPRNLVEMMI